MAVPPPNPGTRNAVTLPPPALVAAREALLHQGWAVLNGVLDQAACTTTLDRLWAAAATYEAQGNSTFMPVLDPNAANVRVFDLLALDECFRDLILQPDAVTLVEALLGPHFRVSNFTANIARPGSGSMALHSDQALVVPEPWQAPWALNIIWCLTDVTFENGATLFVPGSHRAQTRGDLGANPEARLVPFEAKAGSIIAMDGRLWHTSGKNITKGQDRALLFAYYTRDFLRGQVNFNALLDPALQASLSPELRQRLGLEVAQNLSAGAALLGKAPRA